MVNETRPQVNPMELTIELTENCNNNCTHCSSSAGRSSKNLDMPTISKVISDLKPGKIILSGGEPFLHPFIGSIISIAKKSGAIVACNTCGFFDPKVLPDNVGKIDEFYVSFFKDDDESITNPGYYPMYYTRPLSMKVILGSIGREKTWLNVVMMDPDQVIDIPFAAYYSQLPVHLVRLVRHGRAASLESFPSIIEQRGMALFILRQLDPDKASKRIPFFLKHDGYKDEATYSTIKEECIDILRSIYPRCKISHSLLEGSCRAADKRTLLVDGKLIGCVAGKGRDEKIGTTKVCSDDVL